MFNDILVVCVGNICRSPVGAGLLQKHLPGRHIHSAGLAARVDAPVDPTAAELAGQEGVDLSGHRARQLEMNMVSEADLVLVMTQGQRNTLVEHNPAASGKTMLFGQWLDEEELGRDIPDPNGKSRDVFEQAHRLLTRAADAWKDKL